MTPSLSREEHIPKHSVNISVLVVAYRHTFVVRRRSACQLSILVVPHSGLSEMGHLMLVRVLTLADRSSIPSLVLLLIAMHNTWMKALEPISIQSLVGMLCKQRLP